MLLRKEYFSVELCRQLIFIYAHCILAKCENAIVGEFLKPEQGISRIGVLEVEKIPAYIKMKVRNGIM